MPSREIVIKNQNQDWWITIDGEYLGQEPNGLAAFNHLAALQEWQETEELDDETDQIPGIFRNN
jgi:hypothetical protein